MFDIFTQRFGRTTAETIITSTHCGPHHILWEPLAYPCECYYNLIRSLWRCSALPSGIRVNDNNKLYERVHERMYGLPAVAAFPVRDRLLVFRNHRAIVLVVYYYYTSTRDVRLITSLLGREFFSGRGFCSAPERNPLLRRFCFNHHLLSYTSIEGGGV